MKLYDQIKPYQYYILGAIVLLYFLMTFSKRTLVEGMHDSDKYEQSVKGSYTKVMDALSIPKYRANYEDIIKHKIRWCESNILSHSVSDNLDLTDSMSSRNNAHIKKVNNIQMFKESLLKSLTFLDTQ